jgi:hypothetical protein
MNVIPAQAGIHPSFGYGQKRVRDGFRLKAGMTAKVHH